MPNQSSPPTPEIQRAEVEGQPRFQVVATRLTPEAFTVVSDMPKPMPVLTGQMVNFPAPTAPVVMTAKWNWEPQVQMVQIDKLHLADDKLGTSFHDIDWAPDWEPVGVPRDQVHVPICPSANVTDLVLFEDAADATRKVYLPRYRLADHTVSGQLQYRIALETTMQGWNLTLHLAKYPAPEIEEASRTASVLTHGVAVILRFKVDSAGLQKELVFQEVVAEEGGVRASLHLSSLPERDQLYHALTDVSAEASLIVRREITVAVLVSQRPPPPVWRPPDVVYKPPSVVLGPRPVLPWPPKPQWLGPRYREVPRTLDNPVAPSPFCFPPALHGYIFQNITPGSGQTFGLQRCQANARIYYQDQAQKHIFYYLPDKFKIGRDQGDGHRPLMKVRFTSPDGKRESTQATLEYIALPYLQPGRFEDDVKVLLSLVDHFPPGTDRPIFQPLLVDTSKIIFRLALPQGAGMPGLQNRTASGAQVNLGVGLSDALTLSLADFQAIYDALFGESLTLFTGQVEVSLGDQSDQKVPPIPVVARMDDLIGDVFDQHDLKDDLSGGVDVTLRNGIESPLSISALTAVLKRGDAQVPGRIDGLNFNSPIPLKPQEQLTFVIVPTLPLAGTGPTQIAFDLGGVKTEADRDAVWNKILVDASTASYSRDISVETYPFVFGVPDSRPDDQIQEIIVDLELGQKSIRLTPDHLREDATLWLPISEVVLRKDNQGWYNYRYIVVRKKSRTDSEIKRTFGTVVSPDVMP